MKNFMKSMKWRMMLFGILTVIVGIALIIYPDTAARTICMILAAVLGVAGITSIIIYAATKEKDASMTMTLITGIIETACGVIIALNLDVFISFIGIIFGIVILVHGANDLGQAIGIKRMGFDAGKMTIFSGIISILLAILIFANPFGTASALMMVIGISLIIDGITEVLIAFRVGYFTKQTIDVDPDKVVEIDPEDVQVEDEDKE